MWSLVHYGELKAYPTIEGVLGHSTIGYPFNMENFFLKLLSKKFVKNTFSLARNQTQVNCLEGS